MKSQLIGSLVLGLLTVGLTACGSEQPANPAPAPAPQTAATATPAGVTILSTPPADGAAAPVSGIGVVKAAQQSNLAFGAQGLVDSIAVQEGATVKKGDLLATLDVRLFDAQVASAQAAVDLAQAAVNALSEAPRAADKAAAQAQVQQAGVMLAQARINQAQAVKNAKAALAAAQSGLDSARDKLHAATEQAKLQVDSANQFVIQAQARYTQTKSLWDYARTHDEDPLVPSKGVDARTGQAIPNTLNDAARENYHVQFVQAGAALQQAQDQLQQAQIAYDAAQKGETSGVAQAQAQVTQAEANLAIQDLPSDADRVATAQAALAAAQAALDRLSAPPRASDLAQAQARLKQAQAGLSQAQLARGFAEIHAPFDGVVSSIRIHPGDSGTTPGTPAIVLLDISQLHVDVDINDTDIAGLRIGQAVSFIAEALGNRAFNGTVSYIAPDATVVGNVRTYTVRLTPDKQDGLRPGMRVRVQMGH